jgi:hypothetical protein
MLFNSRDDASLVRAGALATENRNDQTESLFARGRPDGSPKSPEAGLFDPATYQLGPATPLVATTGQVSMATPLLLTLVGVTLVGSCASYLLRDQPRRRNDE